jgi:hypothetical protein
MSPEELSHRHPRLYHLTLPGAWEGIRSHGLLSTTALLDLFEVRGDQRQALEVQRRPEAVPLSHPVHGRATLNDQKPMSEQALAKCLDDGLAPADWLKLLIGRVFFWSSDEGLQSLAGARANRNRALSLLVVDTLSLARAHAARIELSPFNTGATFRKPARRGLQTFTPLGELSYDQWSRKRGRRDKVKEVVVRHAAPDIAQHIIEVREVKPEGQGSNFPG